MPRPGYLNLGSPVNRGSPLARGLASFWLPLPGQMGRIHINDIAGGKHGTLTNGPTWHTEEQRPVLRLDGSNDYVSTGYTQTASTGSVIVRAKIAAGYLGGPLPLLSINYDGSSVGLMLNVGSPIGGQGFGFYDGVWRYSGVTTDTAGYDLWRTYGGTYDGSTLKYYLDGNLDAQNSYSGSMPTANANVLEFGRYMNDGNYALCRMQLVAIIPGRAIADSEMMAWHREITNGFPTLLRRWSRASVATVAAPAGNRRRRFLCARAG